MNSKPVEILEVVQVDLEYARNFYDSWKTGGGREILKKYFDILDWIEWNPDMFPKVMGTVQRAILKRSCFVVYYMQEPECSVVLAVIDGRRDPRFIKKMLDIRKKSAR